MGKYLVLRHPRFRIKGSNFDRLLDRYLHTQTSETETKKIEAMLEAMKESGRHSLSKEEEEHLFQKITSHKDNTKEIIRFIKRRNESTIRWILVTVIMLLSLTLLVILISK